MCLLKLLNPDCLTPLLVLDMFLLSSACSLLSFFQTTFPSHIMGQLNSSFLGQSRLRTVWGGCRSEGQEIPSFMEALVLQPLKGHSTLLSMQGQTVQDLKWLQGWKNITKMDHSVTDVRDLAALYKHRDKPRASPHGGWLRECHNANCSQDVNGK